MEVTLIDDSNGTNEYIRRHNDIAFQKIIGLMYSLPIIYSKIKTHMEKNNIEINSVQSDIFKYMDDELNSVIPTFQNTVRRSPEYFENTKTGAISFVNKKHSEKACIVCLKSNDKNMKCSICKNKYVYYCSRECQKKDWKEHKHFCKDLTESKKKDAEVKDLSKGKEKENI